MFFLSFYIEDIKFAHIQNLQSGKTVLVADHQVVAEDAPDVKHLVSECAVLPGDVNQRLYVTVILHFTCLEGS